MKRPVAVSAKKRHGGGGGGTGFALGCGCKDAKSVSVSASPSPPSTTGTPKTSRRGSGTGTNTTTTETRTSSSSFSLWEDAVAELRYKSGGDSGRLHESSVVTTPSFSGLLRELSELEKSVASWGGGARKVHHGDEQEEKKKKLSQPTPPQEHTKAKSNDDKKGDFVVRTGNKENLHKVASAAGDGEDAGAGLEGSVAVVKQSDDPRGDFRRSMLQLIVENGIVAGEDLREMLRRFLTLNAPHHHDAILRAFAEIWDDVFVAAAAIPGRGGGLPVSRREQGRPPVVPRTPPRYRRSPPAWRV